MSVADHPETARCGFCGKGPEEVQRLIAGLTAWICDGCVEVCHGILAAVDPAEADRPSAARAPAEPDAPEDAEPPAEAASQPDAGPSVDPIMASLAQAQALAIQGDRDGARARFAALWDEVGPDGDPLHRVSIAHYLADLQDDVHDELAWDLRALESADSLTNERAQSFHQSLDVAGFYPSLHLNLGDDYARIGRGDDALRHLELAEAALPTLGDDGYGGMIRRGIAALRVRLTGPES